MKFGWRGWLGVAVSAAALWYALRGTDLAEIGRVLRASNWGLFILSAGVATLVFPLRALRWRVILEPVGDIPLGPLWRSVAIGMMVNNVAPARAGEIARAFAISRESTPVPFTTAVASLAVDRIIDSVVVIGLMVLAIVASDLPGDTPIWGSTLRQLTLGAGILAAGALTFVMALAFWPTLVQRTFDTVVGRLAPRFHERMRRLLDSVLHGFSALRSPSRFLRILAWAVAMWLVNALAFYWGFLAVGIEVPFVAAIFVQGVVALAVAAPSTPGYVGVFEASGRAGLALYQVAGDQALSWGFGYHFLSFIPITIIGLYYFSRLGMHFTDLGKSPAAPSS